MRPNSSRNELEHVAIHHEIDLVLAVEQERQRQQPDLGHQRRDAGERAAGDLDAAAAQAAEHLFLGADLAADQQAQVVVGQPAVDALLELQPQRLVDRLGEREAAGVDDLATRPDGPRRRSRRGRARRRRPASGAGSGGDSWDGTSVRGRREGVASRYYSQTRRTP